MSEEQKKKGAELLTTFLNAPAGPEKDAAKTALLAFIDELNKSADEGYKSADTTFSKYIPGYAGRRRKTRGRKQGRKTRRRHL
jgi:hypothetical protein